MFYIKDVCDFLLFHNLYLYFGNVYRFSTKKMPISVVSPNFYCCQSTFFIPMDIFWNSSIKLMTIQGKGSYESRAEMLHLIVELVEASSVTDNPEWRWGSGLGVQGSFRASFISETDIFQYSVIEFNVILLQLDDFVKLTLGGRTVLMIKWLRTSSLSMLSPKNRLKSSQMNASSFPRTCKSCPTSQCIPS